MYHPTAKLFKVRVTPGYQNFTVWNSVAILQAITLHDRCPAYVSPRLCHEGNAQQCNQNSNPGVSHAFLLANNVCVSVGKQHRIMPFCWQTTRGHGVSCDLKCFPVCVFKLCISPKKSQYLSNNQSQSNASRPAAALREVQEILSYPAANRSLKVLTLIWIWSCATFFCRILGRGFWKLSQKK